MLDVRPIQSTIILDQSSAKREKNTFLCVATLANTKDKSHRKVNLHIVGLLGIQYLNIAKLAAKMSPYVKNTV